MNIGCLAILHFSPSLHHVFHSKEVVLQLVYILLSCFFAARKEECPGLFKSMGNLFDLLLMQDL